MRCRPREAEKRQDGEGDRANDHNDVAACVPRREARAPPVAEVLYTVRDARAYLLALPPYRERRNHWQRAGQLIQEEADVEAVSQQFHRALFMDGKLDVKAFERMSGVRGS